MNKTVKIVVCAFGVLIVVCLALMLICNQIVVNNARGKAFSDIDSIEYNKVGPNKCNQVFKVIPDPRARVMFLNIMKIHDLTLFGVSMKGTNLDNIIINLIDQTDEFDYYNEERRNIKRVMFCGVPCGLNIHSDTQDDSIYIRRITLFTSLQNKNTFGMLKRGVVNRYGKPNIEDVDEEEIEEVYYGRCKWTKEGALLRNVHSEEGGLFCILDSHINDTWTGE